jgi:hypothetical protein
MFFLSASRAPSAVPSASRLRRLLLVTPFAFALSQVATAQTTDGSSRPAFLQVFGRLDATSLVLVVGALVVAILLILRIWMMVRREKKPVVVPPRPRAKRTEPDADGLERPTIQRTTDWGFDQNKRAALARSPVAVAARSADLPSLDQAVTQWSISEVHNAAAISLQPNESMGKSPNAPASPYRTSFNPYFKREQPVGGMEVVEVADTLLQAELLVQLGDPKQAMTLLSQHIRETEKPGPAVWLMLLNLYQTTGRKSQYDALAKGFGLLFNAAVPPWATSAEVAARDLEAYPQVMMKLQTQWPNAPVRPFVEALLNDNRGGSRQGFSLKAYRDILFLVEILDVLDVMQREDEEREGIQRKLGMIN